MSISMMIERKKGFDPEFHEALREAVTATHETLRRAGLDTPEIRDCLDEITVKPNNRMIRSAGIAHSKTKSIALNSRLLKKNPDKLLEVVVHEVCHVIDARLNGFSSHGERWQQLMRRCGYEPRTNHGMDVSELVAR